MESTPCSCARKLANDSGGASSGAASSSVDRVPSALLHRAEINELKAQLVYETDPALKAFLHGRIARLQTLEGLF